MVGGGRDAAVVGGTGAEAVVVGGGQAQKHGGGMLLAPEWADALVAEATSGRLIRGGSFGPAFRRIVVSWSQ
eukprot:360666-Chlamydomonas_euryale.AAC.14